MAYQKRNIAVYIILSLVTCSIFYWYWFYCIAKDYYESRTPNAVDTSPGMVVFLSIITCGIYGLYVYYKWGKQTPEIFYMYGQQEEDKSVMYLLLGIFGLDIISMAIIQNDFNKLSDIGTGAYQQYPQGGQPYPPYGAPQQSYAPPAGSYPPPADGSYAPPPAPPPPAGYQPPPAPEPPQPEAAPPPAPPAPEAPPAPQPPVPPSFEPAQPPPPPPGSPYDTSNGEDKE